MTCSTVLLEGLVILRYNLRSSKLDDNTPRSKDIRLIKAQHYAYQTFPTIKKGIFYYTKIKGKIFFLYVSVLWKGQLYCFSAMF